MSKNRQNQSRRGLRGRLLFSTATATCGWATLASPAYATVPVECDVDGPPTEISCVVAAPATIGQVTTTEDNVIIRIGSADTPTTILENAGDGILMVGDDQLALIVAEGSSITSTASNGAFISAGGSGAIFVMGNGDFTGETDGVSVYTEGGGGLSISAHDITGMTQNGLSIQSLTDAGSTMVNVSGTVTGAVDGVNIIDQATGSAINASFGSIVGGDYGLRIQKLSDGDIRIISSGDISSPGTAAVSLYLEDDGDLEFTSSGSINGYTNFLSRATTGDLTAILNTVSGDVRAVADTLDNDVDVTLALSGSLDGKIFAQAYDGDLTVVTQDVTDDEASVFGIAAMSNGTGDVSIITEGEVDLATDIGIFGVNSGASGNISIQTGSVTTTGATAVAAQTDVGTDTDISILAGGDISATTTGVVVSHYGEGAIDVQADGAISAGDRGISITHDGDGDTFVSTAGTIKAGGDGILIDNDGDGDITTTLTDSISSGGNGLHIQKLGDGDVAVTSEGEITAGGMGLRAYMIGLGDMSVTTSADIEAESTGIYAFKQGTGDLTVSATNNVSGGVAATKYFDGNLSVDVTGDVTGSVYVFADSDLTDLTLNVDGNIDNDNLFLAGVEVSNSSYGVTEIDVSGDVLSITDGVKVETTTAGADLKVDGHINAVGYGVYLDTAADTTVELNSVESDGAAVQLVSDGSLNATIHGDVSSVLDAVFFESMGDSANSLVLEGDVTSNEVAVNAVNSGSGDFTVVSTGTVSGGVAGFGVNDFGSGSLMVSAQDVSGTQAGMVVRQFLDGLDLNVEVSGEIYTADGVAFGAEAGGAGAKSIVLNDAISDAGPVGVLVTSINGTGTSLTVAGTASGAEYGVAVNVEEALTLDINNAIGGTQTGVLISADSDIDATFRGLVSGLDRGISASGGDGGTWNFTITESGWVQSGMGYAIDLSDLGPTGELTLTNHGVIGSGDNVSAAVYLSNTSNGDTLLNSGLIDNVDVFMIGGDDAMTNTGSFIGAWWGGDGADTFTNGGLFRGLVFDPDGAIVLNQVGGLIESLGAFDLGGQTLTNDGVFSSGGADAVYTTQINGSFVQSEDGSMLVDVNAANSVADQLNVAGDADLAGTIKVNLFSPSAVEQEFLIVSTDVGLLTDNGLTLNDNIQVSPLMTLGLDFRNENELYLTSLVNFAPQDADLNPNQQEIADEINEIFAEDAEALQPLTDGLLNNVEDIDGLAGAMNQLVPEIYLNTLQTTLLATHDFSSEMSSCSNTDGQILRDGKSCAKLVMATRLLDHDGTNSAIGFRDGTLKIQAAYYRQLSTTLTLGIGLDYDNTLIKNDIHSQADGDRWQTGASLLYHNGRLELGGTVVAGVSEYDTTRRVSIGDFYSRSEGQQKVNSFSGELTASYMIQLENFYLKPAARFLGTHLQSDTLTETGGNVTDYTIDASGGWFLAAQPSIETGGDFEMGNGGRIQPFIRGSLDILVDKDFALTGNFADAPDLNDGFVTNASLNSTLMSVDAGFRFLFGNSSTLTAGYSGSYSDNIHGHGIRFRASFAF
ncbi:MAG: autotransporter outer membrane beta-barrel domain-containing protein [Hyphomonas sp.]